MAQDLVKDVETTGLITPRVRLVAFGVCVAALLLAGYLFGAKTSAPKVENVAPAAAQSQSDGSVVAAREPVAGKPPTAPHVLPKGSTEERRMQATIRPKSGIKLPPEVEQSMSADCRKALESAQCPDVTVDLSLVRQGDGRRVVASSPDGTVVAALDMPLEAGAMPTPRPWAAGLSCDPGKCQQTPGAWIERDLGRIRVGAEAARQQDGAIQGRVRVGWVW